MLSRLSLALALAFMPLAAQVATHHVDNTGGR